MTARPDFTVRNEGSLYLVTPETADANNHLRECVADEAIWYGNSLVVEHRYMFSLALALNKVGYIVDWSSL